MQLLLLTDEYIAKLAVLSAIAARWGLGSYIVPCFSAPLLINATIGSPKLSTADPLSTSVRSWWAHKIAALSAASPSFRGFLIKADSEGQGGPAGYNRTEAQGANMFAELLAPIKGLCIWRAFGHPGDTKVSVWVTIDSCESPSPVLLAAYAVVH